MFPQFVGARNTVEATLKFPVERVQGIVATWIFIAVMVILALGLVIVQLALPATRTETVAMKSTADYLAIASKSPTCPCTSPESTLNESIHVELQPDALCSGDDMAVVASECSRRLICNADGNDRILGSMARVCYISQLTQTRVLDSIASRRVVSPQLMTPTQLDSLAAATAANAMSDLESWLSVPLSIVSTSLELERPMGIDSVLGLRPPFTPVVRTAGDTRIRTRVGQSRSLMSFETRSCAVANASQTECESLPSCVWGDGPFSRCDSRLCPFSTPLEQCQASPSCIYIGGSGARSPGCLDRPCSLAQEEARCGVPLQGAGGTSYRPERDIVPCSLVRGPTRTSCDSIDLQCGSFTTASDCRNLAPSRLCAWDTNRQVCGFIEDWTCPGGGPRSNCTVSEAATVTTNDRIASYLLEGDVALQDQPASVQPDFLTFPQFNGLENPNLAPLWRAAVTNSCSCFDDWSCSSPQTISLMPWEAKGTFAWRCSRTATVATYSLNILSSDLWIDIYKLSRKPINGTSKFQTFGEAFSSAFLVGAKGTADFESYFRTCAPEACTYTTQDPPSFIAVVGGTLGIIGGISVIAQNAVLYLVTFVIGPLLVEPYVKARPEVFGESPPPTKVSEMLASIAADDDGWEEEEQEEDGEDGELGATAKGAKPSALTPAVELTERTGTNASTTNPLIGTAGKSR